MNRQVRDTIRHVQESSELHDRVREAVPNREKTNEKMLRKRRAKEQDIHVGDFVLVHNPRNRSNFLLPFEKDPWVVSAKKGTMVTARRKHEIVTRDISFFKIFRLDGGGMDKEQSSPSANLCEEGDEGSVECDNSQSTSQIPGVLCDDPLSAERRAADVKSSDVPHKADRGIPESLPVGVSPPRQGLECYNTSSSTKINRAARIYSRLIT
ncbi:hypothetical protein NDU88_009084 [Pleurodeles waltl]|uniref:Uncharacterized protein n=1 Tax=Pleurodeles waltl TaxID=8319 RepID=A0AAV7P0U9_PLEWA|nr:hypothetical protein NDU88_009084 [Pleurodeles waltl]